MKRTAAVALSVGLLAFLGGVLAERSGYFGWLTKPKSEAAEIGGPPRLVHYHAVLAAGDASIPNFDNAVLTLANRLQRADAKTTILTSDGGLVNDWRWYATAWMMDEALSGVGKWDGCLVFVTSHGNEHGLVMGMDNAEGYYLTPARLAEILARNCGERPTVAIMSGCHTGTFLTALMKTENRIILTAARRDRTSFGCSADTSFTYFDECLLEAMGDAGTWAAIFERTKACVAKKEKAENFEPSLPQAFFGEAVKNLGIE
jgi:hypothetical protein